MISAESVSAVVVARNWPRVTLACVQSLVRQTVAGCRVVVVNNGSTDSTGEAIHERFLEVTALRGGLELIPHTTN